MARYLAACAIAFFMLGLAGPGRAADASDIIANAIDDFVKPGYHEFHKATAGMKEAGRALCAEPSAKSLEAARNAFAKTVDAWSRIEIIRFGPVTEQNRLERVFYWPDRKGIGLRQVQAALASSDPTVTDAAKLAGKSVAMQGLGALEFVLFGTGSEMLATGDDYRCSYAMAIGGNLETIGADLETGWADPEGFAKVWSNPSQDNQLYRDEGEALTELVDVFITGTEMVRDVRFGGFLGREAGEDKPRRALFWRSGKTMDALAGNLDGMRELLEASKLADLLPDDKASVGKEAFFDFGNAAKAASSVDGPVADMLADPAKRAKIAYFRTVTSTLSTIFGTKMAGALGLTAGFSSLDGD